MTMAAEALSPFDLLREQERRSHEHMAIMPQEQNLEGVWSGISFRLGENHFIASLGQVQEVVALPPLARVPGVRSWVRGVANVRGNLFPVIDLAAYLWDGHVAPSRRNRIMVVQYGEMATALLVDEVLGLRHFQRDTKRDSLPEDMAKGVLGYLQGSFDGDGKTWCIFDTHELAKSPRFMEIAALK